MKTKTVLKIIAAVAFVGILFSGYLTYSEYTSTTALGFACPPGSEGTVTCTSNSGLFGLPVCVYGLAMYAIVFALAVAGIRKGR